MRRMLSDLAPATNGNIFDSHLKNFPILALQARLNSSQVPAQIHSGVLNQPASPMINGAQLQVPAYAQQ
jgi:hypothetical protein